MRRLSLRARLLLGVCVLAAAGLVAADIATYASLRSFLVQQVDAGLASAPPSLEGGFGRGPVPDGIDWEGVGTVGSGEVSGHCLVSGCSPPQLPATVNLGPQTDPQGHEEAGAYFTAASRNHRASYRVRAWVEPSNPGQINFVAESLAQVDSTLHRLLLIELLVTLAALAAIAALGFWVVDLGLRPLRKIEQTAAAITVGDLSLRVEDADEKTEVGRLGAALNTMLDRIEASDKRLRRFVADASHELRTPLAAVRAYAELFGRGAAARPEDLERSMTGITRESERMSLLVDDLLLLARLDEGRPLEREAVDFAAVVSEAVDAARAVEPERPIEVELDAAAITGDAGRLRQVVDNLFANVRAHTPAGTPVSVELRAANGEARLTVADHGPGLAEEDAARIFERFYRVDTSRARASGGVGLGLSIVAAVVAAHGGSVAADETPGGGATFVIALPLAA